MAHLTEHQIELISAYIRQNGVAQDELHDDLLDHVCTSIERLIESGDSFEKAFEKTIKLFGPGGLKQVQQQTFELLTEMNDTMKQVTFAFGLTSTFLLLAGTIFKLMHWPFAGVMITLGAVLLALVYLPIILRHKIKESPPNETLMHVLGYLGLAATAIGVLFKVMHWPGTAVMLFGGMAILTFGYVPIYFFKRYKSSVNRPITLSSSMIAVACLILVFALMKTGNSSWYEHGVMRTNEELQRSLNAATDFNAGLYNDTDLSMAPMLQAEANALVDHLDQLKYHLIAHAEKVSEEAAMSVSLHDMESKHNMGVTHAVLIGEHEPRVGAFSGEELQEKFIAFRSLVLTAYPEGSREAMSEVLGLRTSGDFQNAHGESQDWVHHQFEFVPLFTVISNLSKWQLEVRQMEMQTLLYNDSQSAASIPPSGS
ncbi:MAG: hypothetical protein Salg2KO_13440 [Salibacteraceae bacterium]